MIIFEIRPLSLDDVSGCEAVSVAITRESADESQQRYKGYSGEETEPTYIQMNYPDESPEQADAENAKLKEEDENDETEAEGKFSDIQNYSLDIYFSV